MKMQLTKKVKFHPGYFYGLRHSSLHVFIETKEYVDVAHLEHINLQLSNIVPKYSYQRNSSSNVEAVVFLSYWIYAMSLKSEIAVFETSKIRKLGKNDYLLLVPCSDPKDAGLILNIIKHLIRVLNADAKKSDDLMEWFKTLKSIPQNGTNVPRFFQAAYKLGIPFSHIATNLQQYGYGSRSRYMDSSFTDRTSNIGSRFARNKHLASALLHQAGIPVAKHIMVKSEEEALNAAKKLGYPVVVKPANLDGGQGVYAGLSCEDDLSKAFKEVINLSKDILVEKHIYGKDYRLNVFNDEVIWGIERIPAGIIGDGKHTVEELIKTVNNDPHRGKVGTQTVLKLLTLDEEALGLLKNAGYTDESILPNDQFVALRRKANINAGGTPVAIMDKIHPDNRLLAIRATKLLNLDIAGIDILTEDISKSWKESGGVICEVNAQPQLGGITSAHIYGDILKSLLHGNGRIPIILILGDKNDLLLSKLKTSYQQRGLKTGCLEPTGISINGTYVQEGTYDIYSGGKILLMDRDVDIAIVCINDPKVLKTGLPFDRYDLLVLAENELTIPSSIDQSSQQRLFKQTIQSLLPACTRGVINITNKREVLLNYKKVIDVKREDLIETIDKVFTST